MVQETPILGAALRRYLRPKTKWPLGGWELYILFFAIGGIYTVGSFYFRETPVRPALEVRNVARPAPRVENVEEKVRVAIGAICDADGPSPPFHALAG